MKHGGLLSTKWDESGPRVTYWSVGTIARSINPRRLPSEVTRVINIRDNGEATPVTWIKPITGAPRTVYVGKRCGSGHLSVADAQADVVLGNLYRLSKSFGERVRALYPAIDR